MKFVERSVIALMSVAILFAAHQLVVALFNEHGWKGLGPSDWASWVQAIGSIAAILAAIWVGDRAARKAADHVEKMHTLVAEKKHSAIRGILDDADFQCRNAAPEFEGDHDFGSFSFIFSFNSRKFEAVLSAIERIPLHELDSYDAAQGIAGLRNSMIVIKDFIQSVGAPGRPKGGGELEADSWVKHIGRAQCAEARAFYSLAIKALGGVPSERVASGFEDGVIKIHLQAEELADAVSATIVRNPNVAG